MKVVLALLACVSVAVARPNHIPGHVDPSPPQNDPAALKDVIIQQLPKAEIPEPTGRRVTRDLSYSYQTPEGIVRSESLDPATNRITGRVSWRAPDGQPFTVTYQGDYTGYHAQGIHIP